MIGTAASGYCPIYDVVGVDMCKGKNDADI
jgi:hypothetical protein